MSINGEDLAKPTTTGVTHNFIKNYYSDYIVDDNYTYIGPNSKAAPAGSSVGLLQITAKQAPTDGKMYFNIGSLADELLNISFSNANVKYLYIYPGCNNAER